MRWLILGVLIAWPALSSAQEAANAPTRTGPYLGVQPGAQDMAPGKGAVRSRGAIKVITWVGFQMSGQGGRVFVQSTEPPEYNIVPGATDEVVLEFPNTRLHSSNDGRRLDTGWFPTAVLSVQPRRLKGNTTRVIIKLREVVGYDLRQEGNYLFLDFRPPTGPINPPKLETPTPEAQ